MPLCEAKVKQSPRLLLVSSASSALASPSSSRQVSWMSGVPPCMESGPPRRDTAWAMSEENVPWCPSDDRRGSSVIALHPLNRRRPKPRPRCRTAAIASASQRRSRTHRTACGPPLPRWRSPADEPGADDNHVPVSLDHLLERDTELVPALRRKAAHSRITSSGPR